MCYVCICVVMHFIIIVYNIVEKKETFKRVNVAAMLQTKEEEIINKKGYAMKNETLL